MKQSNKPRGNAGLSYATKKDEMGEKEILAALKDIGVELHKTDRVLARLGRRIGRPDEDVRWGEFETNNKE